MPKWNYTFRSHDVLLHFTNMYNIFNGKRCSKNVLTDETLSGQSMTVYVINNNDSRLRFLYHQNKYLNTKLRRLLCNAMIQPFFDYACNAWYLNVKKNLKSRLHAAQNKCFWFCLRLCNRVSIKSKDFEKIKSLPVQEIEIFSITPAQTILTNCISPLEI